MCTNRLQVRKLDARPPNPHVLLPSRPRVAAGGNCIPLSPPPPSPPPLPRRCLGARSGKGRPAAAGILRHLTRGGLAWVIFLGPVHGPFVGDLDGGAWPWLGDAMTNDEVVECPAGDGGRSGGGLQGKTLGPLRLSAAGGGGLAFGCGSA